MFSIANIIIISYCCWVLFLYRLVMHTATFQWLFELILLEFLGHSQDISILCLYFINEFLLLEFQSLQSFVILIVCWLLLVIVKPL